MLHGTIFLSGQSSGALRGRSRPRTARDNYPSRARYFERQDWIPPCPFTCPGVTDFVRAGRCEFYESSIQLVGAEAYHSFLFRVYVGGSPLSFFANFGQVLEAVQHQPQ